MTPQEFFACNKRLAYRVANKFAATASLQSVDRDDVEQESLIALWKAAERYDPSKGVAFSTYATRLVTGYIQNWLRSRARHLTRELPLPADAVDTPSDPSVIVDDAEQAAHLLDQIPDRPYWRLVVGLRMDGYTPSEIATLVRLPAREVRLVLRQVGCYLKGDAP